MGVLLPNVNGVEIGHFNAGVFWTLKYEWYFYITLPLLAWFATPKRLVCLCAMALPLGLVVAPYSSLFLDPQKWILFLIGMVAAQLVAADIFGRYFGSIAWPLAAIALLTIVTAVYSMIWLKFALLFLVFMSIANDSGLFVFLRWRASKFLGTISYSVYLMHGIILFVVFGAVNQIVAVKTIAQFGFWSIACCWGLLTVLISAITYRFVEHPFLGTKGAVGVAISQRLEQQPLGGTGS